MKRQMAPPAVPRGRPIDFEATGHMGPPKDQRFVFSSFAFDVESVFL